MRKWMLGGTMILAVALVVILWTGVLRDRENLKTLNQELSVSRTTWEGIAEEKEALEDELEEKTNALKEAKLTLEESTEKIEEVKEDIAELETEIAELKEQVGKSDETP